MDAGAAGHEAESSEVLQTSQSLEQDITSAKRRIASADFRQIDEFNSSLAPLIFFAQVGAHQAVIRQPTQPV
jgi:hypothetical protein